MSNPALLAEFEALEREKMRRQSKADASKFSCLVGLKPDTWQEEVLRSTRSRILLCCSRQAGKSTCAAVKALHQAIFFPGSLILIIAPSWRQSSEVLRKVQDALGFMAPRPDLDGDSKTEIEFQNGSRIVSLPAGEAKIRGFSAAALIILDEAGDVPDELYHAILPMLIISKGKLLVMGTPKGRRGFFFDAWDKGGPGWERFEVPWQKCPRMDPVEIAVQKAALKEKFSQEFECQFVRLQGGMVYAAFNDKDNCISQLPDAKSWQYLLGIDFGFVDATAFVVVGWRPNDPTLYVMCSFQESGLHADDIAKKIHELSATYRFSRIIGDVSGYGKGPAEELRSRYALNVEAAPKKEKAGYIDLLNAAFAQKQVLVYAPANQALIAQTVALPWNDTRTNQQDGYDDHLCDALLYSFRAATTYLQAPLPATPIDQKEVIRSQMKDYWEKVEVEQRRHQDGAWWEEGNE